uniref:NADH dehydrogenase [ubiquinone] 1 alpha subcomplex subunit 8 n=1 Tax=Ciona intestinalis TaxID=7719 RepID=F6XYG2_CIOIN|nr:NADH dehydrogenase [ubiquinone] 1 alpha subcomplex subunit 8 [Ciona intestinalis]|eukprot:XP_002130550.1 NADH dehydrogenase [ubiquinone] 1 alpha subcomplex subunit 8 [Ciona intestinalis]
MPGNFINPYGHVPVDTTAFEEAAGVKEKIDPELAGILKDIKRGDLGVPSHVLKASAFQYANECNEVNKEFMLCREEEMDPRKCLKYNIKVSDCAENFFRKMTTACADEIVAFGKCLERDHKRSFVYCRDEQVKFDRCMFEKLGIDKKYNAVELDQTVKTDRPAPKNPFKLKNYDHPSPLMPDWNRPLPKIED